MVANQISLTQGIIEEALTSPAYRKILSATMRKACSVKEISETSGIPMASAYRNVKALEERGLLLVERSAMTSDGKPYDLYRARLEQAIMKITRSGVEVTWQVNHAVEDRILHLWNYLGR